MLPVTSLPPNLVPPGAVPGLPGQPPAAPQLAATPPIPGQQNTDEVKNRIMQAMQQISQQRQLAMRPVVPNLPARQDPNAVPGYMQGPNWGPERFLKQSSALIHNAARKMQETRIQKAESDWNALAAAVETNNQSLMNAILSDPRKVKNMAKVFQMDWLNPKPTPHSIALSRVAQQTGLRDQAKKNFFVRLFHALRGGGQQQPYSPQQIQEIESRLPTEAAPQAAGDWIPISKTNLEMNRKTGETRPIAGMPSPVPKSEDPAKARIAAMEDKIIEEYAKLGLKPTFDDQGHIASVSPIPGMPKPEPKAPATKTLMVNGKEMVMAWNPATKKYDIPEGEAPPTFAQTGLYEITNAVDPQTGNIVPATFDRRTGKIRGRGALANRTDLIPIPPGAEKEIGPSLQDVREADKRLHIMEQNEPAALAGDQQAMLSLVANHIGMTLGAQKGARINQAVWNEAVASAPLLARVRAKFNKDGILSGVFLAPQQVKQMVDLAHTVDEASWQKAQQTFAQYGIPFERPSPSSIAGGGDSAPSGASAEVYAKDGKTLIGHIVNGKYVPLPKR
jgi:hypothetical protein